MQRSTFNIEQPMNCRLGSNNISGAVNLADMMSLITLVGCPIAAGLSAASQKAGWFTLLFVAFGIALGFGCSFCVNRVSYLILFASCKQKKALFHAPLFLGYLFIPMILAFGFMALTGGLAAWLAKYIF
jgi:hypothetical protein